MKTLQTKVLIIGAGPTGLMMACQLARYKVPFLLIDQKKSITNETKALGVQARTMEVYQQMGIAQEALRRGLIGEAVNFVIKGKPIRRIDLAEIGKDLSPFPYIHMLVQHENEALLQHFLKTEGESVLWNTHLDTITQTDTEVEAVIITKDGERQTVVADWLVGADGGSSTTRHQLGMSFKGETHEQTFFVADTQIDWAYAQELHVCLDKTKFLAFFPMKGDRRFRIVGALPSHLKDIEGIQFEVFIEEILKDISIDLRISNTDWFSTYKIHHRVVDSFQRGRCFLAGDSAHLHSPVGAQGMNTGLLDAYNLAWKLSLVVKEKAAASLLKTYTEERLPFAQELVNTTDRVFGMIVSNNPFLRFFRRNVFPTLFKIGTSYDKVRKFAFGRVSQTGINYRKSSINRNHQSDSFNNKAPQAGDRFPYITSNKTNTFDWLDGTAFQLLYFYTKREEETIVQLKNYLTLSNLDIQFYQFDKERNATFFEGLGIKEQAIFIVRPDMYIGYRSGGVDLMDMEVYFSRLLGGEVQG